MPKTDFAGCLTATETIRDRGVTIVPGAPSMWTAFAHFDELAPDTFATVRRALSGASRLPIPVAERMKERFGVEILEGYGLTEASPTVTTQVGHVVRPGSVGRALDGVEVRLVNNGNTDALVGDVGEIWVRGADGSGWLDGRTARFAANTTARRDGARVRLTAAEKLVLEETVTLAPDAPFEGAVALADGIEETDLRLAVVTSDGRELISYQPTRSPEGPEPPRYEEPPAPGDIASAEELENRYARARSERDA